MALRTRNASRMGVLLLAVACVLSLVSALDPDFCADINTASTPQNISNLQSNGLCQNFCKNQYAFSITQGKACWCSNYFPAKDDITDASTCDAPCPGFPYENCGNSDNTKFGYLQLYNVKPSGTQGGKSATSSKAEPTSSSPPPPPSTTPESRSSSSSKTKTKETHASTATSDEPQVTTPIIQTVVAGDGVKTVTVFPTETGDRAGDGQLVNKKSSGLGTGAIAGIAVGVILGVLLIVGALIFWFLRRRKAKKEESYQDDPSIHGSAGSGRQGRGSPTSPGSAGNRSSMLQIDPRMDPFRQGLYVRSGSAESVNTLRDDHDYSRRIQQPKVLRAVNPDPDQ